MTYRSRIDLGVAAVVIAIGLVFAFEASRIDPRSYEAIGPRLVPAFLACLMIGIGAVIGLNAWIAPRTDAHREDSDFGFRDSDIGKVVGVIAAGAIYTFSFWALGYFVSTIIGAAFALWVFGVRKPAILIVAPILAGLLYQIVFMGFMGLLDPRGALFDLRWLSAIVTPGA